MNTSYQFYRVLLIWFGIILKIEPHLKEMTHPVMFQLNIC